MYSLKFSSSSSSTEIEQTKFAFAQDFATISYSVPGYFESPDPSINIYTGTPITAEKLDEEVLFKIPDPSTTFLVDEVPFLEVANRRLSMVVLPKHGRFNVRSGDGVKVISGKGECLKIAGRREQF